MKLPRRPGWRKAVGRHRIAGVGAGGDGRGSRGGTPVRMHRSARTFPHTPKPAGGCCWWRRPALSGAAAPTLGAASRSGRSSRRRDPPLCTLQGGFGQDRQPDAAVVRGGGRASPPAASSPTATVAGGTGEPGRDQRRHRWPVGAPGPSCMPGSYFGPARRSAWNAAHRTDALVAVNASPGVAGAGVRQSAVQNGSGCY